MRTDMMGWWAKRRRDMSNEKERDRDRERREDSIGIEKGNIYMYCWFVLHQATIQWSWVGAGTFNGRHVQGRKVWYSAGFKKKNCIQSDCLYIVVAAEEARDVRFVHFRSPLEVAVVVWWWWYGQQWIPRYKAVKHQALHFTKHLMPQYKDSHSLLWPPYGPQSVNLQQMLFKQASLSYFSSFCVMLLSP